MNTSPRISIVTPSFNQGPYLEQTITSVLSQNYKSLEYFIMDGGSTDQSVEIIKRHEHGLSGWVSEKDAGQSDAIARGFAKCSGDILAYINSDDYYLPGAFQRIAKAFEAYPDADLIYGDVVMVDSHGRAIAVDVLPAYSYEDLIRVCMIPQQAAFWSRAGYGRVGGVNPNYYFTMDYDLFLRLAQEGRIIHIPAMLAAFRQHREAKTSTRRDRWMEEQAGLHLKYLGREKWNASDWLRMKWLTVRQIACIAGRRMLGEKFPSYTPARWNRLYQRKLNQLY